MSFARTECENFALKYEAMRANRVHIRAEERVKHACKRQGCEYSPEAKFPSAHPRGAPFVIGGIASELARAYSGTLSFLCGTELISFLILFVCNEVANAHYYRE